MDPKKQGGGGAPKGKSKGATAKKGEGGGGPLCANCGGPGSRRCGGCGEVHYCRKNIVTKNGKQINRCQQVRTH